MLALAIDSAASQHHRYGEAPCRFRSSLELHPRYCGCVLPGQTLADRIAFNGFFVALGRSIQTLNDKSSRSILKSILQMYLFHGVTQSSLAVNGGIKLFPNVLQIHNKSSRAILKSILQMHLFHGVAQSSLVVNGGIKVFPSILPIHNFSIEFRNTDFGQLHITQSGLFTN